MGKNNKKKKHETKQTKNSVVEPSRRGVHGVQLPLPYPRSPDLPIPENEFLRNQSPYKSSFQAALDTAYEGFVVDEGWVTEREKTNNPKNGDWQNPTSDLFPHDDIRKALSVMEDAGFFRTDVTQPFGLGTKCAKTYVTRCLLGERGATYKYLGLRMFAHPWDDEGANEKKGTDMSLKEAISTIRQLNDSLSERTKVHLSALDSKRKKRGAEATRGRAKFDITLINRMENTDDLKMEPSMGKGRCSVSWHADSSLEHYSTIAVYHSLFSNSTQLEKNKDDSTRWSVALRVAHNSEGPRASRRGMDIDSSIVKDTPPIAVSLPTGSAYYLLDDFNHHHQHAVVASGGASEVRFSSTHRLLRESHNVAFVIERCRNACSNFHKKGPKIWRSEQLLLTEIESEWLRQYYIQGRGHNELLWESWGDPILTLLRYWSQLESRTKQTIDLLKVGAEGRCGLGANSGRDSSHVPSRSERKMREKRRKACATLEELLSRNVEPTDGKDVNALESLYKPVAEMLEERAKMRELWAKRESDHVFRELGRDCAPIPFPVDFCVSPQGKKSSIRGSSPMEQDLRSLATGLRALGKSFMTRDPLHLPDSESVSQRNLALSTVAGKDKAPTHEMKMIQKSNHSLPLSWDGWNQSKFGLEMQSPWAEFLLEGRKTIETRLYDLPQALLGKRIDIIKTRKGTAGVSSLGNVVTTGKNNGDSPVEVIGWCVFSHVIKYVREIDFTADEGSHLVTKDSGYGWKAGKTQQVYGWVVGQCGSYKQEAESLVFVRRMRSLFEIQSAPSQGSTSPLRKGRKLSKKKWAREKKQGNTFQPRKKKRKRV